jgi:hypothetical protein
VTVITKVCVVADGFLLSKTLAVTVYIVTDVIDRGGLISTVVPVALM